MRYIIVTLQLPIETLKLVEFRRLLLFENLTLKNINVQIFQTDSK